MKKTNIAIIGGGHGCIKLLDLLFEESQQKHNINILIIADINPQAPAIERALSLNIITTADYHDIFSIKDLDFLIDLTGDPELSRLIEREKPYNVKFINSTSARFFLNLILSDKPDKFEDTYSKKLEKDVEDRTKELKASKLETERQKKTAEGIIYGSPAPMFVLNKDHRIIYWNKACEKLTGFRSEEMIGTDRQWEPFYDHRKPLLADVIIDNDAERMDKVISAMNLHKSSVVEDGYESEFFVPNLGEGGAYLYINAAPIKDEAGNIQGAIVSYQDFTERVKMTQEIKRRESFVQNLIQNSIDGIIATDKKGKITVFNRGAMEILGYQPEEIIGRVRYREILSEKTAKDIREAFYGNKFGPEGKIINMDADHLNKAREIIPVRLSGTLIYEAGKEVGSVVFIQDLREIYRLQKEKEKAERMAAVGSTMAGLAHYIKNILTGLQGGAYVLNSAIAKNDLELVGKGWDMIRKNIDQIGTIVMDMLIYSRERKPKYQLVDPNALVKELIDLMEERAKLSGVKIEHDLKEGLGRVAMDETAIHSCLLNLITNAIDACTLEGIVSGKGIVKIRTERPEVGGVRFIVSDNGTGMDEDTQKRLFADFFTTKGYRGTGLGLPVTQKIISEHGGELSFESKPGQGTTFSILLPERVL
ncbi:MAG TPA: PAS domain S-box protein [Desulfobacteraceae bacterium]|nr:PAS domain S-box protein [Desulfobacteraceae bacterium]HPJ68906.1 PAS domain S-box protein [Desulfobacteraceae bacterium]HPQ27726.1 PAS domain S-box protein [Desulfobacteraceae bacterium]